MTKTQITGKATWQAVSEKAKENGFKEFWSLYPFKEKKLKSLYAEGSHPKYGIIAKPKDDQIKSLPSIINAPLTLRNLRTFFLSNKIHNAIDLPVLSFDDIMSDCLSFFNKNIRKNRPWKNIEDLRLYCKEFYSAQTEQEQKPDDLMPLSEILDKITSLSRGTLKRKIQAGTLKGYKIGKCWYVSKQEAIVKLPLQSKYLKK